MRRERIFLLISLGANLVLLWALFASRHQSAHAQTELAAMQRELARQAATVADLESAAKTRLTSQPATVLDAELVELARLRNEVTRLRNEQRAVALATNNPAARRTLATVPTPVASSSPITKVTSTVSAQVPLGHVLALGGWAGPEPGQRIVGFITPATDASTPGQVLLQTHLVTLPDRLLDRLGLQELRTDQPASQSSAGLDPARLAALLKLAEQQTGVSILSVPRVVTNNGQAAQVSVTQALPDGTQTGPVLKLTPTLDATGTSVRLDVGLELNLPAPKP